MVAEVDLGCHLFLGVALLVRPVGWGVSARVLVSMVVVGVVAGMGVVLLLGMPWWLGWAWYCDRCHDPVACERSPNADFLD